MHVRWGVAPRAPVQGMTRRRGGLAAKAKGGIMTEDVEWFAGVDWASQEHRVCLVDADGKIVGERGFAHGGAGLAELCAWLLTLTGALPAAVDRRCDGRRATRVVAYDRRAPAGAEPARQPSARATLAVLSASARDQ